MSCFVINKEEYAKAAGFIAGFLEFSNRGWRWNRVKERGYRENDVLYDFIELYKNNRKNVEEEWNKDFGEEANPFEETYSIFEGSLKKYKVDWKYCREGAEHEKNIRDALARFVNFMNCILYQSCDTDECEARCIRFQARYYDWVSEAQTILDGLYKANWEYFEE